MKKRKKTSKAVKALGILALVAVELAAFYSGYLIGGCRAEAASGEKKSLAHIIEEIPGEVKKQEEKL